MIKTDKKKLTINDIAKLCGVGKSTVSRVINQDPMVNEETRQKVNQIIEKYQFTPQNLPVQCEAIQTALSASS